MPQCKAKFCKVKRGHGISTFPIPDPEKNKELCEKWIHKLGIENLNIKTFKFSKASIICEKHFEDDCFKEDMQAKIMGYTPKRRYLKEDAVPTIFEDTKLPRKRRTSQKRPEKKRRMEVLEDILREDVEQDYLEDEPSTSVDAVISRKRKGGRKKLEDKLLKEIPRYVDVGIQVQPTVSHVDVSCNIKTEDKYVTCPNCFAQDNPSIALNDHAYTAVSEIEDLERLFTTPVKKAKVPCDTHCFQENDVDSEIIELETPEKEHKDDPSYSPSENSDISPMTDQQALHFTLQSQSNPDFVHEKKFIVFFSSLMKLFGMVACITCKHAIDIDDIKYRYDGTCVTVTLQCLQGHTLVWRLQPMIDHQPVGNILVTAASLLSGVSFSALDNFATTMDLLFLSRATFHKFENELVIPIIDKFWNQQKSIITKTMAGRDLVVSGDGRCDSPGFSAKYCTYTIMEANTSAILGFNVVQVTESDNSATKMELTGFKRTMQDLQFDGLSVVTIATDRHVQIRKCIREAFPYISHQFDVWHMSKSVRKKLLSKAKKKGNEDLMPWIKSISNHLWYCASHCNGDAELLEEMWVSIIMHIQNIHQFEGNKFSRCGHPDLSNEESQKKKWLGKKSKALKALKTIVCNKRLLKDIRQLNLFCHTGDLESYHSMMLKYVPKRLSFNYSQMVARTQLAALDHNFNLKRAVAMDADGNPRFGVVFPKATGRWSVRKLYVAKKYDFRQEMMMMVLERKLTGETSKTPHQDKAKQLPKNIARLHAPSKSELTESHASRFKIH